MTAWTLSYPLDTVKTIMQCDSLGKPKWTVLGYFRHVFKERKVGSLYNGLGSVLLRGVPINMIFITVWDTTMQAFEYFERHDKQIQI